MALNKSFRVKDSLYVGTSGFFAGTAVSIDTSGKILSGGRDLADLFKCNSAALTQGNCITNFSYDGTSAATVAIDSTASGQWDTSYTWVNTNGDNVYNTAAAGGSQGQITLTDVGNAPDTVTITDLSTTSSPTFGGLTLNGEINMTADKIVNVADPTSAQDAATKAYVDATGAGTVCSVTAGNLGIDIGGTATDPTVCLNLSELTTSTADTDGDFFAVVDSANAQKKLTKANINISGFNNDSGFTDCEGTVCSIATGNGISGGTITGSGTLTVAAGTGLTQTSTGLCVAAACDSKWSGTYSDFNSLSGTYVTTGSSPSQGTVRLTSTDVPSLDIDTGLQTGDSPTFAGVTGGCVQVGVADDCTITTASGNLTIDSAGGTVSVTDDLCVTGDIDFDGVATGDGSGLTGVTATPSFPTTCKANLASTDKLFINDNASCQVSGNKHVEYCDLLTDIAGGVGTGLEVTSGNDSICLKNASSLCDGRILAWDDGNGQLNNTIISDSGSKITVSGDHLVTGNSTVYGNLSVTGDFTCIETTVSTTSALSVTNTGTGPALFVKQGGTQPIAHFIDSNGGDIIFADDGKLGIGTFTPSEKLDVVGSITASNNLTIEGNIAFGDSGSGLGNVILHGNTLCIPQIGDGAQSGNKVLVRDSNNCVKLDSVDSKIFTSTTIVDGSGTINKVAKYTATGDTIGDSKITDTGSLVTIDSDTKVDADHSLSIYAAGGSIYAQEKTFTASVGTGGTTVATFAKSGFDAGKYIVTLIKGVNKTVFEVLVTYNGTASFGTVYGIVDAQAASQLTSVDVTNSGSTIDLVITSASATTTAIVHGKAFY